MYNLNIIIHNSLLIKSTMFHINYSVCYWSRSDDSRHCLDSINLIQHRLFYQMTCFCSVAAWFHYYFLHFWAAITPHQQFLSYLFRLAPNVSSYERELLTQSPLTHFITHRQQYLRNLAIIMKTLLFKLHEFVIKRTSLRIILISVHFLSLSNQG